MGDGNANGLGALNGLPSAQQVVAQTPQTVSPQAGVEQTTAQADPAAVGFNKRQLALWNRAKAATTDQDQLSSIHQSISENKYGKVENAIAVLSQPKDALAQKLGAVKLPKVQQQVFDYILNAIRNDQFDSVFDVEGKPKATEIAAALGKNKGSITAAINGMGKHLEALREDLRKTIAARQQTQVSDAANLGMSPARQNAQVVNEADLFGNAEAGAEQSMGIINSIGGSQSEIGRDVPPPTSVLAREDSFEVLKNRQAALAASDNEVIREARENAAKFAEEAQSTWNEWAESTVPAGVPFSELDGRTQVHWLIEYADTMQEYGDRPWSELEQILSQLYSDYASDLRVSNEQGKLAASALESQGKIAPSSDVRQEQISDTTTGRIGDDQVSGADNQSDARFEEAVAGEPVPAEATGRADSEAQNPVEARVADLKASLGEKQGEAIDRFVGRYASGEITLDRLNAELDNFDAQLEDGTRYSTGVAGSTTVDAIRGKIKPLFFSNSMFDRKVEIVSKPEDLPAPILQAAAADANMSANEVPWDGIQAFVQGGKVYMIADNIAPGRELAVFLHEVGVHLGMKGLIGQENLNRLALQIKKWAIKNDGSRESELAKKALARVKSAQQGGIDMEAGDVIEERIAYFIEEAVLAGINPTAMGKTGGPMQQWFRTLWAAVKTALRKFGLGRIDSLTAQNLVDVAYGAARLELEGTWHGTAADFRNFDHSYMGSGEGAQAFGWGTYVAQRPGIAKGYWEADIGRKTTGGVFRSASGFPITDGGLWRDLSGMVNAGRDLDADALATLQRTYKETLAKWEGKDMLRRDYDRLQYSLTELEDAIADGGITYQPRSQPEGSLMRVDVAVTEDEMLDWDKPLSEQSEAVKDVLEPVFKTLIGNYPFNAFSDWADSSGRELYEQASTTLGSDKAASEYLDSIGIKGIKFLDANSRDYANAKFKIEEAGPFRTRLEEKKPWSVEIEQNGGYRTMNFATKAEAESWVAEKKNQTRNLVIFNDKNIQRVVTQVGADRERLKFSANFSEKLIETLPTDLQDPVASTIATAKSMFGKAGKYSVFTSDLVGMAQKFGEFGKATKKWFDLVNRRETLRTAHEAKVAEIGDAFYRLDDAKFRSTWNAIQFMTKNQKWAYQPTWKSEKVTIDAEAKKLYDAMSAEEKTMVDRVFKHGAETLNDLRTLVDQSVDTTFDGAMKRAKTDAERAAVEKDRAKFKRLTGRKLSELSGPYAPMTRVGKYVTVAQSQQYIDALKNGEDVSKLAKDKDHYVVVFSDSQGEADAIKRELLKTKKFVAENIRARSREEVLRQTDALPFEAFDKMRNAILDDGGERNAAKEKMVKLLNELYLISLADTSARKSELKRNNTSGMEDRPQDMFKAFMSKGMADAHYIGNLSLGKEVADAFAEMRKEAAKTGNTKDNVGVMDTFNELKKRAEAAATYQEAPVVSRILGFNSLWMLLTKPAYHFYNATQPFMMTLPELTRRHNYTTAANAMVQAYKDLFSIKDINLFAKGHINLHALPADVRDAVIALRDQGKIDITMTQEMGAYIHQGRGKVAKGWQKIDRAFRSVTQKVEMMNRLVSAIAAIRLERAAGTPDARALDYAARVVDVTQGNYTNFNAPRLFNATSTNRLLTQFRKFQLIQLGFYYRLMRDSMKGATPEETKAARAALMFTLGHHAILAGSLGLPAASLVALAFGASGDDDEKRDLELWMRKELGGGPMADLLTRGVPAALFNTNISGNVGAGEMLSLMPFTDVDLSSRDGMAKTVLGMMGPTTSHLYNFADAMHFTKEGDLYRAFEVMQPSGIRGALKSWREASEGVTNRRGDLLVTPEEVDLWASLGKAAGFKTMDDSTRQLVSGAKFEFETFYNERTTWMKNQYVKAYKEGDDQQLAELRQRWLDMQATKRELGFTTQPLSNLLKSIQEANKREANTVGGIQVRTNNRKFVEQFVE